MSVRAKRLEFQASAIRKNDVTRQRMTKFRNDSRNQQLLDSSRHLNRLLKANVWPSGSPEQRLGRQHMHADRERQSRVRRRKKELLDILVINDGRRPYASADRGLRSYKVKSREQSCDIERRDRGIDNDQPNIDIGWWRATPGENCRPYKHNQHSRKYLDYLRSQKMVTCPRCKTRSFQIKSLKKQTRCTDCKDKTNQCSKCVEKGVRCHDCEQTEKICEDCKLKRSQCPCQRPTVHCNGCQNMRNNCKKCAAELKLSKASTIKHGGPSQNWQQAEIPCEDCTPKQCQCLNCQRPTEQCKECQEMQDNCRKCAAEVQICAACKSKGFSAETEDKVFKCAKCRGPYPANAKYTHENDMTPSAIPNELKGLTVVEKLMMARVSVMMKCYRLRGGQRGYSGNTISLPQEIGPLATKLPRILTEKDIILIRKKKSGGKYKDFRVRRSKIETALRWLKTNNPLFGDIEIGDCSHLPDDGFLEITEIIEDVEGSPVLLNNDEASTESTDAALELSSSSTEDILTSDQNIDPSSSRPCDANVEVEPVVTDSFIPFEVPTLLESVDTRRTFAQLARSGSTIDGAADCDTLGDEGPDGKINGDDEALTNDSELETDSRSGQELDGAAESVIGPGGDERFENVVIDAPEVDTSSPINDYEEGNVPALAFPWLFPDSKGGSLSEGRRLKDVSLKQYFTHLLEFEDGRFEQDATFCYYAYNTMRKHGALSTANYYVNERPQIKGMTKDDFQSMSDKELDEFVKKLLKYRSKTPGTKQYWHNEKTKLLSMIEQLGDPVLFFTLSAADTFWPDLHAHIPGSDQPGYCKSQGVINNPKITDEYSNKKLEAAVNMVLKRNFRGPTSG